MRPLKEFLQLRTMTVLSGEYGRFDEVAGKILSINGRWGRKNVYFFKTKEEF